MCCGRVTEMTCLAGGSPGQPPWQDCGYLDLRQKGVNGGQVWQGGGDVQESLGQGPPQLQVLQRPLGTVPQLHPRGAAQPGARPLHAVRAGAGETEGGERARSVRERGLCPDPGEPGLRRPQCGPCPLCWAAWGVCGTSEACALQKWARPQTDSYPSLGTRRVITGP